MKNGEGTEEKYSSEATSPSAVNDHMEDVDVDGDDDDELLPWDGQKSDGGDDARSSQYSSCGESSFERYCSANSVMGTPSVCSSVYDFPDSDFGFLSFKLGEGSSTIKKSDRKLSGFSEPSSNGRGSIVNCGKTSLEYEAGDGFWGKSEGFELDSEKFLNHSDYGVVIGNENSSARHDSYMDKVDLRDNDDQTASLGIHSGLSEFRDNFEDPGVNGMECGEGMVERCLDYDETSSRHEYSEGEDSMFGGASDGEQKSEPFFVKNTNHVVGAENANDKHGLFMTSDVTYGFNDWDDFIQETGEKPIISQNVFELEVQDVTKDDIGCLNSTSGIIIGGPSVPSNGKPEDVVDIPIAVNEVHDIIEPLHSESPCVEPLHLLKLGKSEKAKHGESSLTDNQTHKLSDSMDPVSSFTSSAKESDHCPVQQMELESGIIEEKTGHNVSCANKTSAVTADFHQSASSNTKEWTGKLVGRNDSMPLNAIIITQPTVMDTIPVFEDHFSPDKKANIELNGFYDEMVHDMEEILLDTSTPSTSRSSQSNRIQKTSSSLPSRDGGSTASTSGTYDANPLRIKDIEVVGARQKNDDVSLSERLVGVKEYTIYQIRVWSSDDVWEIERRFRDFFSLYRVLKKLFADRGWILPAPWLSVEQESKKIFGGSASPNVIEERSVLMQECLRSIIHYEYSTMPLNAMLSFLLPSKSLESSKSTDLGGIPVLGKTVSLVVQIHPYKSMQQMLDAQCHTCAGCHKDFNSGLTRITDLARTLGWGKPRLCEYSGQLFCSTCHTNDTAVLPAKVLHQWDFTQYPVSQVAKSYLESIYDKPMLCVSAVNPFLFLRVPALQHVTSVRKRIGAMIPFVRCPFRMSVYKALGPRRYLLEGTDFFALRDLIDLSKGMFAVLPVMVETVSSKILEHITEQCLICCDTGIPCNARQACNDPSALIFPFQEGEIERCISCKSVFHSHCFSKITVCPCGARLKPEDSKGLIRESGSKTLSILSRSRNEGETTGGGLFSGLLSKMMPQKSIGHKNVESKDNDTVILMGELPSNTL